MSIWKIIILISPYTFLTRCGGPFNRFPLPLFIKKKGNNSGFECLFYRINKKKEINKIKNA
jgi:hypothetical protein